MSKPCTNTHGALAWYSMRILITGSSGQLGAAIAEQLGRDHELIGIDVNPGLWTQRLVSITDRRTIFQLAREVDAIIHVASLHQPHIATCSEQDFIETNVLGTLTLLEAAAQAGIRRFVYTSTTSLYGRAMVSHRQAVWVTEDLVPRPRDIYDRTKITAEHLCRRFALSKELPTICLRVARFFPQPDSLHVLYRLYRGVDVRDVAAAHALAVTNSDIQFGVFNIAARSPFLEGDVRALRRDAVAVLRERAPGIIDLFAQRGWKLPTSIDRVYVIARAERSLGYRPRHNFDAYLQEACQA